MVKIYSDPTEARAGLRKAEIDPSEKMLDDLEIHFIQLSKIEKSDQELKENLKVWLQIHPKK